MSVGVIIPFFNAQNYLKEAIESCLIQDHVSQVLLVNDGSIDDSFQIAQSFVQKNQIIKLISHENNLGRSAARNTGLKHINTPFISFLDADDYFLKSRFDIALQYLKLNPKIDGVYEPVVSRFQIGLAQGHYPPVAEIKDNVSPEKLFEYLVSGKGSFSIIGCTFKNSTLSKMCFDENLKIGEDTDFIWRAAYRKRLKGIQSDSRVVRRVHGANTLFDTQLANKGKFHFYKKWKEVMDEYHMTPQMKKKLISSYAYYNSLKSASSLPLTSVRHRWVQGIELLKRPSLWPFFISNG